MSSRGTEDIDIIEGTTNREAFTTFLKHNILPIMQPFNGVNPRSILVLDNASIYNENKVIELADSQGGDDSIHASLQSWLYTIGRST